MGLHLEPVFAKNLNVYGKVYVHILMSYFFLSKCFFLPLSQQKWGRFSRTISLSLHSARHTSVASPRCARLGIKQKYFWSIFYVLWPYNDKIFILRMCMHFLCPFCFFHFWPNLRQLREFGKTDHILSICWPIFKIFVPKNIK